MVQCLLNRVVYATWHLDRQAEFHQVPGELSRQGLVHKQTQTCDWALSSIRQVNTNSMPARMLLDCIGMMAEKQDQSRDILRVLLFGSAHKHRWKCLRIRTLFPKAAMSRMNCGLCDAHLPPFFKHMIQPDPESMVAWHILQGSQTLSPDKFLGTQSRAGLGVCRTWHTLATSMGPMALMR